MIELYCFDVSLDSPVQNSATADSIMNIKLISDHIYAIVFKSQVEVGIISHLASSFFISQQQICSIGRNFTSTENQRNNDVRSLFVNFDDNSVAVIDPVLRETRCTIYPPPTPSEVCAVIYIRCIERMFLLLQNGTLCVYNIDQETGYLEKMTESKQLRDYEGKGLSQHLTCITKCLTKPPQFDCEIFSDLYKYKEPLEPDYELIEDPNGERADQFIVIGLSKGTVLFVRVNDLDHIYSRFSIHRQAVT